MPPALSETGGSCFEAEVAENFKKFYATVRNMGAGFVEFKAFFGGFIDKERA